MELEQQLKERNERKTRPRRAATEPALWTVREGASEGGDGTQTGNVELIQTLLSMRKKLLVQIKDDNAPAATN